LVHRIDPQAAANKRTAAYVGWAICDYRGGFGVVTKQDGQPAQVDESVAKALGLSGRHCRGQGIGKRLRSSST
jgi:hypothetical protein